MTSREALQGIDADLEARIVARNTLAQRLGLPARWLDHARVPERARRIVGSAERRKASEYMQGVWARRRAEVARVKALREGIGECPECPEAGVIDLSRHTCPAHD